MGKLVTLIVTAAILAVVLGGGCVKPALTPNPQATPTPVKTLDIGIATPLTGPMANLGTNIQNGILLAIDDQNKQGGVTIAGQKYMLNAIIRDTKHDVVVAKSIADELILDKGVKVICGSFIADAIGMQLVTEKNKVIMLATNPNILSPAKPYTFFLGTDAYTGQALGAAYIQKFYPESKVRTVISMEADLPGLEMWTDAAKIICPRYGLDFIGYEKFPITTTDFMPVISRMLAKKPDIINTSSTGGTMGGMCCSLIKQLREAGFDGIIWSPTLPPPDVMMEVVPDKQRTRIVTLDIVPESPIVSQAYRDMNQRYIAKFGVPPIDIAGEYYNGVKAFFEFLNGQDTMDTTAWMEGFAKYRWQGLFGFESYWVGKPIFGIDRALFRSPWVSEWTDGKLETKWVAPLPYDLLIAQ